MRSLLKISVGIATAGRREILAETLRELSRQTRMPECVFVCPAAEKDFDSTQAAELPCPLLRGQGSTRTVRPAKCGARCRTRF
jgi:hypothetical protein